MAQPVLTPVQLTSVKTVDGELLSGLVIEPKGRKKAAVIWVHGLTSSFDGGQTLMRLVSSQLQKIGVGYFKFNTRGYGIADYGKRAKTKSGYIGGGFEKFTDCVKDIDAVIRFARSRGYGKIFLVGHSTGANKILYYASRRPRTVQGLGLLAPVSDIVGWLKHRSKSEWKDALRLAKKLYRKDRAAQMPVEYGIMSAARFLSLYKPGAAEDVFPWYNPQARWTTFRSIRIPVLVVFGSEDKYLNRAASEVVKIFAANSNSRSFSSQVLHGAEHGFQDFQYAVSRSITKWIQAHM